MQLSKKIRVCFTIYLVQKHVVFSNEEVRTDPLIKKIFKISKTRKLKIVQDLLHTQGFFMPEKNKFFIHCLDVY